MRGREVVDRRLEGKGGGTTDLEEARDRCRLEYTCPVDSCACQCLFSLPLHVLPSFLPVALSFTLPALLPVLDRGARFYARTRHVLAYKQQIFLVTSERVGRRRLPFPEIPFAR